MWWYSCSSRRGRRSNFGYLPLALLVLGMAFFFTHSFMPFLPIFIVLFIVLPAARGTRRSRWADEAEYEKPKNDFDFEKPKRDYMQSDDGDMLEIIEEEKPKSDDDIEYI